MTGNPLTGADLYDWIALRRVSDGGIARAGVCWFDTGRRVPGYVASALTELRDAGLVTLTELDDWDMARATLTGTGATRYQQLCRQQQLPRLPRLPATDATRAAADQLAFLVAVCRQLMLLCCRRTRQHCPSSQDTSLVSRKDAVFSLG